MGYGGGTWYMDRTIEELKNYGCVWLISICIIRESSSEDLINYANEN